MKLNPIEYTLLIGDGLYLTNRDNFLDRLILSLKDLSIENLCISSTNHHNNIRIDSLQGTCFVHLFENTDTYLNILLDSLIHQTNIKTLELSIYIGNDRVGLIDSLFNKQNNLVVLHINNGIFKDDGFNTITNSLDYEFCNLKEIKICKNSNKFILSKKDMDNFFDSISQHKTLEKIYLNYKCSSPLSEKILQIIENPKIKYLYIDFSCKEEPLVTLEQITESLDNNPHVGFFYTPNQLVLYYEGKIFNDNMGNNNIGEECDNYY